MGYTYHNVQKTMLGGKKIIKKVTIKNSKGYKSICNYKNGKKCYTKKQLSDGEVQLIKMGKFIPGLFNDISISTSFHKKTRKN